MTVQRLTARPLTEGMEGEEPQSWVRSPRRAVGESPALRGQTLHCRRTSLSAPGAKKILQPKDALDVTLRLLELLTP